MKNKRIKRNLKSAAIAMTLTVCTISAGVFTTVVTRNLDARHASSPVYEETQKQNNIKTVTLSMVGDNLLHMPLLADAKQENGTYHFDKFYEKMIPHIQADDIAVVVQETVLGGSELGYSGYPTFNSPQEMADSLERVGFDVVLQATNHAVDKGEKGILNTIACWEKHPNVMMLGFNKTQQEADTVRYYEKNGIRFAFLNYTDSTNGISLPTGKNYLVNKVDKDKMAHELAEAEQNADMSVVFMHWGTEYSLKQSDSQKELATFLTQNGADLIMGSHPHVIEPIEWVQSENGNKSLVFYSMGNFVSRQKEVTNLLGAMGRVKIVSDTENGTKIESASIMPVVTHYSKSSRNFCIYPFKDYTDELAKEHGVSQHDGTLTKARWKKTIDTVFPPSDIYTVDVGPEEVRADFLAE